MLCLASATPAAHEMSQSISRLTVDGTEIRAVLQLNGLELPGLDRNGDGRISFEEIDRVIEAVYADVRQNYIVRTAALPRQVALERYSVVEDHVVELAVRYAFDAPLEGVTVESTLQRITSPTHTHLTTVTGFGTVRQAILGESATAITFWQAPRSTAATASEFLRLGVEHITTGYDHLAFLIGLVLASASLLPLAKAITFFTVGHSVTLALATFDVVAFPVRLIESLIALSVGYVALECLVRPSISKPALLTFGFGLVHGFGFSNVLREMDLPRSLEALSLFAFNTGVELGQLVFVLVLFPLIAFLRTTTLPVRQMISVLLIGVSLYWFTERAFG